MIGIVRAGSGRRHGAVVGGPDVARLAPGMAGGGDRFALGLRLEGLVLESRCPGLRAGLLAGRGLRDHAGGAHGLGDRVMADGALRRRGAGAVVISPDVGDFVKAVLDAEDRGRIAESVVLRCEDILRIGIRGIPNHQLHLHRPVLVLFDQVEGAAGELADPDYLIVLQRLHAQSLQQIDFAASRHVGGVQEGYVISTVRAVQAEGARVQSIRKGHSVVAVPLREVRSLILRRGGGELVDSGNFLHSRNRCGILQVKREFKHRLAFQGLLLRHSCRRKRRQRGDIYGLGLFLKGLVLEGRGVGADAGRIEPGLSGDSIVCDHGLGLDVALVFSADSRRGAGPAVLGLGPFVARRTPFVAQRIRILRIGVFPNLVSQQTIVDDIARFGTGRRFDMRMLLAAEEDILRLIRLAPCILDQVNHKRSAVGV